MKLKWFEFESKFPDRWTKATLWSLQVCVGRYEIPIGVIEPSGWLEGLGGKRFCWMLRLGLRFHVSGTSDTLPEAKQALLDALGVSPTEVANLLY